jgi:heme oxygenase
MAKDFLSPDSLPGQINAATRSLHTSLNRFITSRLPLCLPPYTEDRQVYGIGLLHFSHVIFTFEQLWTNLVSPDFQLPATSNLSPELAQLLRGLRPEGLARSPRLKRDLKFLTALEGDAFNGLMSQYPGARVDEYCNHIRNVVSQKPHVLLAYAWCYYMAVFSGGRWIRGELLKAGEEFWHNGASQRDREKPLPLEDRGLAFWNFDGTEDGEDIKLLFKAKLSSAHDFFTPEQVQDIILESQNVFKYSAKLVEELDEKLGTDLDNGTLSGRAGESTEKRKGAGAANGSMLAQIQRPTWLRRPEVTGAAVILACLTFIVFLGLDPRSIF